MARAILFGIPVSPGIAIARLCFLHGQSPDRSTRRIIEPGQVAAEQETLRQAAATVRRSLAASMENVPDALSEYRDVIAAQIEIARDPKLINASIARIGRQKICAAHALEQTMQELCALFRDMDDPYLRDRAQDVRSVALRISDCLNGDDGDSGQCGRGKRSAPAGVLAAEDISPADVIETRLDDLLGIVTAEGGITSHTSILARNLNVPALTGVTDLMAAASNGEEVILDGLAGCLLLGPDKAELARYRTRQAEYREFEQKTLVAAHWPAEMTDGVRITVQANLDDFGELAAASRNGAEGIGLYRTEFRYLGQKLPEEEELYAEYLKVAKGASPERVIFRTLDIGADKIMSLVQLKEPNPALGLRGIRFSLRYPQFLRPQLRALLRAGLEGNAAIMLPMISQVEEIRAVRQLIGEIRLELRAARIPHANAMPLGIMVETPAAVLVSDALARECDFFSIGTNDLIHYLLAIDRCNRHVSYLHDPLHPAVIRSLKHVIDAAHREGIPVTVCGELGTDPCGLAILLGMGVDGISAAPAFVPGIKQIVRQLDAATCQELANNILMNTEAETSRQMASEILYSFLGRHLTFHTSSLLSFKR